MKLFSLKGFRFIFFLFFIFGVLCTSFIFVIEKPQAPFQRSLAPLFLELGKPIKSIDRAISCLYPIEEIDEKQLGSQIKLLLAENSKPKTLEEEVTIRYLNELIGYLSEKSGTPFNYQVFLVNGPVNAYAMPGGAICVTKDLMNILENEAELVAILSHEMGHIERGHLFDAARGEMLRRKIGETSVLAFANDVIHMLARFTFSKTQEDEADEYGFRMLVKKGYDPMAMSAAFKKFALRSTQKKGCTNPLKDFFMTHPHIELRVEKFHSRAKLWRQTYPKQVTYLGEQNFRDRVILVNRKISG